MLERCSRPSDGPAIGRRARSLLAIATCAIAGVGVLTSPSTVQAGQISPADVVVQTVVIGPDAGDVMDGLTIELWADRATEPLLCTNQPEASPGFVPVTTYSSVNCLDVPAGDYFIGIDGVPAGFSVQAECTSAIPPQLGEVIPGTTSFSVFEFAFNPAYCNIAVVQPTVLIDKVIVGGTAATDDFTIEVYSASGGSPIATGVDPSPDSCLVDIGFASIDEPGTVDCAIIGLSTGDFRLGELAALGYLPTNVGCAPYFGRPTEMFPDGIGEFSLSGEISEEAIPVMYCEVTNTYSEGSVTVTKRVVNDDGGTASAADFTAEVFVEGGALATRATCASDGTCISADLPIGGYRIGESGPGGYAATVTCSSTGGSVPEIGTVAPSIPVLNEAITGDAALVDLGPGAEVTCVITNDDVATTTTIDPNVGILPPTGSGNRAATVMALGLLALGGTLVALRRRTV